MKVFNIMRTVEEWGYYAGALTSTVRILTADDPVDAKTPNIEVGVPFITDKLVDLDASPLFVSFTGGDVLGQPKADLFNFLQVMGSAWYGIRGTERVIIHTDGQHDAVDIMSRVQHRAFTRFVFHLHPATSSPILRNMERLTREDTIVVHCNDQAGVGWGIGFLSRLSSYDACRPTVVFTSEDTKLLSWTACRLVEGLSSSRGKYDLRVGLPMKKVLSIR